MGTFDWTHEDTSLYAPSQVIRFSTALASRLASRNWKLENEVDEILFVFTGGEGAFTQWVWVELIESSETIRLANTHQVHAEFI